MIELQATCAFGLESLVAEELRALGYDKLEVDRGNVRLSCNLSGIARTNLWLRCADRVLLQMARFKAQTFDELYEGVRSLAWGDWIPRDGEFPVVGKSVKSKLTSVPACQSIVKKAVVDSLTQRYGQEHFEETGPRFRIQVSLLRDVATITLDTSGTGLHKRGYRDLSAPAPLRETLAAAIIYLSHWQPGYILADPCCGSGTLLIEAALIGRNIAPGTLRTFDAFKWPSLPRTVWTESLEEADDLARNDQRLRLWGSDISEEAIGLARHHAARAGFEEDIELEQKPLADFRTHHKYGYLVCNPPYGERLGDLQEAEALYREMGQVFPPLRDWSWFVLTPHEDFETLFGAPATHRRKLYNGRIKCTLYQYFGPKPPGA